MYDRTERFKKIVTSTPDNVGPSTYLLSDIFDKNVNLGGYAPFNTMQIRSTGFLNKCIAENPSPNKYKIVFRKQRIVGGTSLQYTAPRVKEKVKEASLKPYSPREPRPLPGKIHRGVPPRSSTTKVTSIPEKGAMGYKLTVRGPVKFLNPPENKPIGPSTYYNPQGVQNYTTLMYKGNFWSLRTANRFFHKEDDGPSAAEYDVTQHHETPWQKHQILLQSIKRAQAPLLRSDDIMMRKLCREDLPGPGEYFPLDPNTKKCDWGKFGTFSKAQRNDLYVASEGPGPAAYTSSSASGKVISVSHSPFGVDAQRFPPSRSMNIPGPGDYSPKDSMWEKIKNKAQSKYSRGRAPFDSSAHRNTVMTRPDVLCIPGPDWYNPQIHKKGNNNPSSMFSSSAPRPSLAKTQDIPGPASYSTTEQFNKLHNKQSHLLNSTSAFLTSGPRLAPLLPSPAPAPTTYNLQESSLNERGCTMGMSRPEDVIEVTPGPQDYQVHPKYAKSSVFNTYNVTLKPEDMVKSDMERRDKTKILRSFSENPHDRGHCRVTFPVY